MTDYDGKDRPEHYELPDGDERTELRVVPEGLRT